MWLCYTVGGSISIHLSPQRGKISANQYKVPSNHFYPKKKNHSYPDASGITEYSDEHENLTLQPLQYWKNGAVKSMERCTESVLVACPWQRIPTKTSV